MKRQTKIAIGVMTGSWLIGFGIFALFSGVFDTSIDPLMLTPKR